MSELSDAIEQLYEEGLLKPGWTVRGDKVELADGDTLPTKRQITEAIGRREAKLAKAETDKETQETSILTKLLLTKEDLRDLKEAMSRV